MTRHDVLHAPPWLGRTAGLIGLLGVAWVVALTVIGAAAYPGYDHVAQYISELGARGAPHAAMVNLAGFLPAGLLLCTFAMLAWTSLPRSRTATLGCLGLFLYAVGYVGAGFFPCDARCRPDEPSLTHLLHTGIGLAGYLLAPLTLLLLSHAARHWPGAGSLRVLALVAAPIALAGLLGLSPEASSAGLAQRALEGSVLIWVAACAWYLRRRRQLKQA
jgi:hypothetical membrane protein